MRLPDLRVSPSSQPTPGYGGVQVVPQRSGTGEQLQEFGGGLLAAGVGAARVADYLQDQIDEAKSQTEFNLYAEEVRKIERTYEAQVGEGAVNGMGRTLGAINDARKAAEARLGNDTQHTLFRSRADVHDFHVRDRVERHGIDQTRVYQIGAQTAGAKVSNSDYLFLWQQGMPQDPPGAAKWQEATRLARETGIRQINKVADLHGDSPEVRKLAVLAHTTDMHEGVVRLLAEDRSAEADLYLQKFSSEIDPRRLDELRGLAQRGKVQSDAQRISLAMLSVSPNLLAAETQVNKLFDENKLDIETRDETVRRMRDEAHNRQRERDTAEGKALQDAQEWVSAGNSLTPAMEQALHETGTLWKYRAWQEEGGANRTTPYGFKMLNTTTPDELLKFPTRAAVWNHYRSELSDKHLPLMVAQWEQAQAARGKAMAAAGEAAQKALDEQPAFAVSEHQQAINLFRIHEGQPDMEKPTKELVAKFDSYEQALFAEASRITKEAGRTKGRPEDLKQAADNLLAAKTFEASPIAKLGIPESEQRERAAYTNLRARGIEPTPEQISQEMEGIKDVQSYEESAAALRATATQQLLADAKTRGLPPSSVTPQHVAKQMEGIVAALNEERQARNSGAMARGDALYTKVVESLLQDRDFQIHLERTQRRHDRPGFLGVRWGTVFDRDTFIIDEAVRRGKSIGDSYLLDEAHLREVAERVIHGGMTKKESAAKMLDIYERYQRPR